MVKCTVCKKEIAGSEAIKDCDGYTYCIDCAKSLVECVECGCKFSLIEGEGILFADDKDPICNKCADNLEIVQCLNCEKHVKLEDSYDVQGDVYCRDCVDKGYIDVEFCESCREPFYTDDMVFIDDCAYCSSCSDLVDDEEEEFYCNICGQYVEDYSTKYDVCNKCIAIAKIRKENGKKPGFTNADVYAAYPDLDDRIDAMFERSAALREKIKSSPSWAHLKSEFPYFSFDSEGLMFADSRTGKTFPLLYLARERTEYTKPLAVEMRKNIKRHVDMIYNARSHREKMHVKIKPIASGYLLEAIRARFSRERRNPKIKEIVDAITGTYSHGDLKFIITNDPVAVMGKTTAQCWEELSCEKIITGVFGNGPFSDVLNSNPLVFAVNKKEQIVGRIMLRYGKADTDGHLDFGIEYKWYICGGDPDDPSSADRLGESYPYDTRVKFHGSTVTLFDATQFVITILKKKGFYKYNTCKTPYVYDGYSDTVPGGHVTCTYRPLF